MAPLTITPSTRNGIAWTAMATKMVGPVLHRLVPGTAAQPSQQQRRRHQADEPGQARPRMRATVAGHGWHYTDRPPRGSGRTPSCSGEEQDSRPLAPERSSHGAHQSVRETTQTSLWPFGGGSDHGRRPSAPRRPGVICGGRLAAGGRWRRWPLRRAARRASPSTGPGLADKVAVQFQRSHQDDGRAPPRVERLPRQPRGRRRPQHLRPVRRRRRLVGQGGEDKQAQYGDKQISVIAGDNIGASPLVDGLFFGEPSTIVTNLMNADFASVGNHEFDKGARRAPPDPERRLPRRRRLHGRAVRARRRRHHRHLPRRRLPVPVGQRRARRQRQTLFPAFGTSGSRATAARSSRSGSSARCSRRRPPSSRRRGVAGLTFQDEADAANRAVARLKRQGVNTSVLVIHQGGFQARHGRR